MFSKKRTICTQKLFIYFANDLEGFRMHMALLHGGSEYRIMYRRGDAEIKRDPELSVSSELIFFSATASEVKLALRLDYLSCLIILIFFGKLWRSSSSRSCSSLHSLQKSEFAFAEIRFLWQLEQMLWPQFGIIRARFDWVKAVWQQAHFSYWYMDIKIRKCSGALWVERFYPAMKTIRCVMKTLVEGLAHQPIHTLLLAKLLQSGHLEFICFICFVIFFTTQSSPCI